jgi:glutaredoxin
VTAPTRGWGVLAAILVSLATVPCARGDAPPDIEVFSRQGCPRCADAERFLEELTRDRPGLTVVTHDVVADPAARARLAALAAAHDTGPLGVPSFLVGDRFLVGFASAATSGAEIRAALDAAEASVRLPLVGALDADRVGLPLFTVTVGLIDGLNPCATWVLLFLLSLLVNLHDRRRMLAVAGTFVVVSGAVYLVFMLAWLNAFLLLGASRPVEIVLAAFAILVGTLNLKDAAGAGAGPSVRIPSAARPTIYSHTRRILYAERLGGALAGATVLAVLVNVVELACTAGLPALYTRILTRHALGTWERLGYLLLYDAAYMLDDALMVMVAVVTLSRLKLQERGGRVLKATSGLVMLALGMLLLLAPERLTWERARPGSPAAVPAKR